MSRFRIAFGLVLVIAIGLLAVHLLTQPASISIAELEPEPTEVVQQEPLLTTVQLEVHLGREVMERALNSLPTRLPESGDNVQPAGIGGPIRNDTIGWWLARSPIGVTTNASGLTVETALNGRVRLEGRFEPVRGDVGRLLGRPRIPFSQSLDFAADVTARAAPTLDHDWSLHPNLSASARLTVSDIRIANAFTVSVRSVLQPHVDRAVRGEVDKLNAQVAQNPFLRDAAAEAWADLCRDHPLPGAEPLVLSVRPVKALAAQPVFDDAGLRLLVGIEATTHVTDRPQEDAACTLPELTIVDALTQPDFRIALSAALSYDTLDNALADTVLRRPARFEPEPGIAVTVRSARLVSAGERLRVVVDVRAEETRWFGAAFQGPVVLSAIPSLSEDGTQIRLSEVRLDAVSAEAIEDQGTLGRIAVALLQNFVDENVTLSLAPAIADLRSQADAAAAALNQGSDDVKIDVALGQIALDGLAIGNDGLFVSAIATGTARASIVNLAIPAP